jgi:hypothetical protein
MKENIMTSLIGVLLMTLNVVVYADIQSDVKSNLPLSQIIQRALDRQETATNIATELVASCVKVANATGEVLKVMPEQASNVTEAIVKAIVVDNIVEDADCRRQITTVASTISNYAPYYKATNVLELGDITINEVPYRSLSEVATAAINAVPHLRLAIVINALPSANISETVNAVKSMTRRDVIAIVIKNSILSDTVVNSQVILNHQSDILAVAINLAGITNSVTAETSRTVVMLTDLREKRIERDGISPTIISTPEGGAFTTPTPTVGAGGSQGGNVSPSR